MNPPTARAFLEEESLRDLSPGTPAWFARQRELMDRRPLVKRSYDLWYQLQKQDAQRVQGAGAVLELGSGSSFLKESLPELITSDVQAGIADRVIDARNLPFEDSSVRAIVMSHVFHHIPDVSQFLAEAERVLVPGGVISLIEVSHTPFARFFFDRFHPELYDDQMQDWKFHQTHQMMDSNQALSWMVFFRDRDRFMREHPSLAVEETRHLPWFGYLLSGGLTRKSLVPRALASVVRAFEDSIRFLDPVFGLHWYLRIRKKA